MFGVREKINRRLLNVEPQNNEVDGKFGIYFMIRNSIFVNLRFNTDCLFCRRVVAPRVAARHEVVACGSKILSRQDRGDRKKITLIISNIQDESGIEPPPLKRFRRRPELVNF